MRQIKPNATHVPDGIPYIFYQYFWEIFGNDVTNLVLKILNFEENPKEFNNTFICIIPKIKSPITHVDYRPIAMCNIIMKLITKTIAN